MKKRLLMIGLLASSLSMMAQEIFNFGFETPSSDLTVGKLEFVNFMARDSIDNLSILDAHSGTKSLWLKNTDSIAGANYQRALKFRNLPVEPNTSYRLTFWVKGNNTYKLAGATTTSTSNIRARMEVGKENADVPFVGAANTAFDYTFTGFDPANWVKKTAVFYYANDAVHQAYYKSLNPDSVDLTTQYFLNLNVFNPGTYFIDDVSVVKSTIKGITFNGDVIKVDFGYAINGDALRTGKDYATASLPIECVNVTNDGVPLVVEAVEVQSTGFYIFLAADYLDNTAEGKLKIDFTNPVDPKAALLYTNNLRPNWESTSMRVADFTNEEANFDMNMSGLSSSIYYPPFLKSVSPENESFDLPFATRSFTLVYSKPIDCSKVTASLAGPSSYTLDLAETGYSNTLTFNVKAADVVSSNGTYILSVKNIVSEVGTPAENTVLSYDFGVAAGGTIDTLYNSEKSWSANADGTVPHGFKRIFGTGATATVAEQDAGVSSVRMFRFAAGGQYTRGVYICYREGKATNMYYGLYADQRLHLMPGKYSISVRASKWDHTVTQVIRFAMMGLDTVAIFKADIATGTNLASSKNAVVGSTLNVSNFTISEEKNYLMNFNVTSETNWNGLIFGAINLIKIPSNSFVYHSNLTFKLNSAQSTLTTMDSSIYNGVDKTALTTVIQKYAGFSSTAPSAFSAAIADVDSFMVKATAYKAKVDAHFASIVNFHANVDAAKATLTTYAGGKYAVLSAFPKLGAVVAIYDGLELTNDDSLKVANDTLSFYNNLMKNWVNTAIPALKYRINKALVLARSLKVPVPESDLAAAEALLTDDDQVANALNAKIKQYLSHNLALDSIKFGNSLGDPTITDSLEMTCFIKNPNFYTRNTVQGFNNTTFPGWVSSTLAPNLSGTAGIYDLATSSNPVRDTYVSTFNTAVDTFYQVVTGLPNGIYNVDMHTRTGLVATSGVTQADINKFLKFYVIHGTDTTNVGFTQDNYGLSAKYVSVRNVTVTDGTLTLGIRTSVSPFSGYAPSLFWGDPTLWLVGKAGIYDGVKQIAVNATVKEVQYYTIQGFRMNAPGRGLNIVRTIYENGAVEVQKIMIK